MLAALALARQEAECLSQATGLSRGGEFCA
jgi:hypothetical protein